MVPFDAAKLERLMADAGIDLILATSRHNVRYLTGGYYLPTFKRLEPMGVSQYLPFVGLPRRAVEAAFYVGIAVPDADEEQAIDAYGGMWIEQRHWVPELRGALATRTTERAARAVRELGLAGATVGIEHAFLPVESFEVLRRELPEATFADATPLLAELRAVKSARELAVLRQVHEQTAQAIRAVLTTSVSGETSQAIEARLEREMAGRGLHRIFSFVCIGPGYDRYPSARRWQPGCALNIDTVAELDGYLSDLARMASLSEPPPLALELFALCTVVQARVRETIGPGVPCGEVYRVGTEAVRRGPSGAQGNFVAHGLGLVSNEYPTFSVDSVRPLEPGMVISVETEYRHPAVGHVKLEDTLAVTATGAEALGEFGRDWCVVAG